MKTHLEHLRTEPFTIHREWTESDIPVLRASVSLPEPVPALNAVCRRIRRYYRLQGRAFLRYCQRTLLPMAQSEARAALAESRPLPEFQAELSYEITYNAHGFWSLYTQVREHTLPGQDFLLRRGDTWDLNSGYPAALADLVPRRSGWTRRLVSAAEAEALRFEQAAHLRDQINAIAALGKKQTVIAGLCADTDIWGLARSSGKCCYAILHMEGGNLAGRETELFTAPVEEDEGEMLGALTAQYYLPRAILPHEILLPQETEGYCENLSQVLTQRAGHKVWVHVPRRGEKADLLAMAERNAAEEAQRATSDAERTAHTLELLAKMLDLPAPPSRLESFDISNTGSSDIVASMVVYSGIRPLKSAYRRFRIKDLAGTPDDYASMREVLRRRLQRAADGDEKFLPLPDVFLIDGGVTHAAAAQEVAQAFGVTIPIFGMVKDDRHRTRALVTPEGREIGIVTQQAVFTLIGRIQEETHRFAITYHHQSHEKSTLRSALDGIPGVGPKRREELKKAFGTIRAIREADVDALAAVIPRPAAEAVWRHFHGPQPEAPASSQP